MIGKQVAIKVLARKYSADPEIVSRVVAEARAVNQSRHRHIIDIFSFGTLLYENKYEQMKGYVAVIARQGQRFLRCYAGLGRAAIYVHLDAHL